MYSIENKILRSLERHGALSKSMVYRYFHRYHILVKNKALQKLLQEGLIDQQKKYTSKKARKPAQIFVLSQQGRYFLKQHRLKNVKTSLFIPKAKAML
jgi:hypothetical protein